MIALAEACALQLYREQTSSRFNGAHAGGEVALWLVHLVLDISYISLLLCKESRKSERRMAVATLTSKGQITIPSRVRHALGLEAGDRVEFVEQGKGQFAIVAATRSVQELKGLFRGKRSKPVSVEEMNSAIARRASGSR